MKISKGHIGACTNGRMADMRVAAKILKGRKVHPDVMLNITPGSVEIYRQCLKEESWKSLLMPGSSCLRRVVGSAPAGRRRPWETMMSVSPRAPATTGTDGQ